MEFFEEYKLLITILHLLGVVIGFGAAIAADFLFFRFVSNFKLSNHEIYVMGLLSKLVWIGLSLILLSGLGLFLSAPDVYVNSSKFLLKMLVVGVITINGGFLHFYIKPRLKSINWKSSGVGFERRVRKLAFAAGGISFSSWMLALVLGTLASIPLSFPESALFYLAFLFVLVVGSQIAEYLYNKFFAEDIL